MNVDGVSELNSVLQKLVSPHDLLISNVIRVLEVSSSQDEGGPSTPDSPCPSRERLARASGRCLKPGTQGPGPAAAGSSELRTAPCDPLVGLLAAKPKENEFLSW